MTIGQLKWDLIERRLNLDSALFAHLQVPKLVRLRHWRTKRAHALLNLDKISAGMRRTWGRPTGFDHFERDVIDSLLIWLMD
jgi:hypothetical protein